jgi:hypothetical protein
MEEDEEVPLSHIPLVWMVREAQRAGLNFDAVKLRALHCAPEEHEEGPQDGTGLQNIPQIITSPPSRRDTHSTLSAGSPAPTKGKDMGPDESSSAGVTVEVDNDGLKIDELPTFHRKMHVASAKGKIHDVLCFGNGSGAIGVIAWVSNANSISRPN